MPIDSWAGQLTAALASEDPWQALADDPELSKGVEIEVVAIYEVGVPVGRFTEQVGALDQAFRYAAKSAETQEDPQSLRARGGRPIPVNEGLVLEQVRPGSNKFPLVPSLRIKRTLDGNGLRVVLVVCGLLGGGNVVYHIVDEDDPPKQEVQVKVATLGGHVAIDAPPQTDIRLTKNGKTLTLRIRPAPKHP